MNDPFNIEKNLPTLTKEEVEGLLSGNSEDFTNPGSEEFEYSALDELDLGNKDGGNRR